MNLDAIASLPKYRAHLQPVWDALPGRGEWYDAQLDFEPQRRRHRAALVASYTDMRTARRHGYGRIALLEHGIGQSYSDRTASLPGGDDRGPVGLFLSPNAHAAARDAARYPRAKVVVVGSTVLDTLPRKPERSDPPVIALTWHWSYARVPEMRSAFDHFRDALAELSRAHRLLGHAHPQAEGMVKGTYDALGIEYDADYRRVLGRADLLVADNTSALYEFASTGRPVVVLNAPFYRRDVEHGLRFWRAATIGVQCDEPADVSAAIDEALEDKPAQKAARKAALAVVYGYQKGAAKRAAKALVEWLG